MPADDLVDDWALAPPSAKTTERTVKPDVSRHRCVIVMGLSSKLEPALSSKRDSAYHAVTRVTGLFVKMKSPSQRDRG